MAANSQVDRVGVWGRSGSGKSFYVKYRVRKLRRVIVFDPMGEYRERGFTQVEHRARDDLDKVKAAIRSKWKTFKISYVPLSGKEAACLSALSKLLLRIQEPFQQGRGGGPITLVVDELNLSFPVGGGAQRCPGFAQICSRGRHFGIEVIGTSQRIAEVDTRFRGNCSETVVFRQKGPRDHAAAAAELGISAARMSELGEYQFFHEKGGKISIEKI